MKSTRLLSNHSATNGRIERLLDFTYADIKNTERDGGKNLINCYNKNTMLESK